MSENNLTGYEKRYNAVYNYLDTHKALKNFLLLLYKVLPYVTALSYMVLIVLCARSKSTIATPAIALSVDATGYVETSNAFITAKLILAPLTSFIFVSNHYFSFGTIKDDAISSSAYSSTSVLVTRFICCFFRRRYTNSRNIV